ncbi:hypothetical protein Tco_0541471 [Tanacetum coccineum]
MSILPDDQMNSVINCLTAKSSWDDLILYYEGPYDVKESRAMDLKLCYNTFKFKEGETLTQTFTRYKALMNNIYESEKKKSLVTATPLSTAFFSTSIVQDFQDSPDDEEDTKSSQEYLNDLEEEYQERALLAKSKRFFKKGTQRFSGAKATDQNECHHVQEASMVKNKGLITKAYEWDEEEVSSDENEMVEVKVLMVLAEENDVVSKEAEGFIMPNHNSGRILLPESQRNITNPSVAVTNSSATDYDSTDESSVCSTPLPPLKKLDGAEPISGPKTIKSI